MANVRESVFLSKLNQKIHINKLSMADEERVEEKVGLDKLNQAFQLKDSKNDFSVILAVLWEMLDTEDKRKIAKVKPIRFDGLVEIPIEITDPVEMLKAIISGADELEAIVLGMMRTFIMSRPDISENAKKKLKAGQS